MTDTIFCPNDHLIFNAPRCPKCGWERPLPGPAGSIAFRMESAGGTGTPGGWIRPGVINGVLALPLAGGGLVAWDLPRRARLWQTAFDPGFRTFALVSDGERWLISLCDERDFIEVESAGGHVSAKLAAISSKDGALTSLWEGGAHRMDPPVVADRAIALRTVRKELVVFSREASPRLLWRQSLSNTFGMIQSLDNRTLLVSDGQGMGSNGWLRAIDLDSQRLLWEAPVQGLLTHPVAVLDDVLVYRGERSLGALSRATGKPAWGADAQSTYLKLYSRLASGDGKVFLSIRGSADTSAPDHYALLALDAASGRVAWRVGLPDRVSQALFQAPDLLLLGTEHGEVLGCSARDGTLLWRCRVGGRDDRIATELLAHDGLLIAGLYSGQVGAVRVSQPAQKLQDPNSLLKQGDLRGAADAFALAGSLERAGDLYAGDLKEPRKALLLYEHAGLKRKAADLALELKDFQTALDGFAQLGEMEGQVKAYLGMGDELKAAPLLVRMGRLREAAQVYEKGGDPYSAWKLYLQLRDLDEVRRLSAALPDDVAAISFLEEAGLFLDAAEKAFSLGLFEKAANLFEKGGYPQRELEALQRLVQVNPEDFSLARLVEVAKTLGRFQIQADAFVRWGRQEDAAAVYRKAAQQMEAQSPLQKKEIADLYEKAVHYFAECGMDEEKRACRKKVVEYRELPWVELECNPPQEFIEKHFNKVDFQARNTGVRVAYNLSITVNKNFELHPDDTANTLAKLKRLHPKYPKDDCLTLRPNLEQAGRSVLILTWTWTDEVGQGASGEVEFSRQARVFIDVKTEKEAFTTPIFNVQNMEVKQEIGQVNTFENATLSGVNISGKNGVQINRSAGEQGQDTRPRISLSTNGAGLPTVDVPSGDLPAQANSLRCPSCGKVFDAPANFCDQCQADLRKIQE
jgi:outer membrane protein assembly factor BamB